MSFSIHTWDLSVLEKPCQKLEDQLLHAITPLFIPILHMEVSVNGDPKMDG